MLLLPSESISMPAASFGAFIFRDHINRWLLTGAIAMALVKILLFRHFFPYMDFTSDTFPYMQAALLRLDYNIWPIGYSRFLWLFHQVSRSEIMLSVIQFAMLELSSLFFYFSVVYIFQVRNFFRYGFYAFLLVNPLFIFLGNYLISDALFLTLGLLWITLVLWMLYRPATWMLIVHGLLLAAAFTVRYNAMFYPFVALVPILLSRYKPWQKLLAVIFPLMLIAVFVQFMRQKSWEHSGVRTFSVFSGWQMMNNAMYMLPHLTMDSTTSRPEFALLQKDVYKFTRALHKMKKNVTPVDGSFYMWEAAGPQKRALQRFMQADTTKDTYTAWASLSVQFADYGADMIRRYPLQYARYYLLDNAKLYLLPPLEVLGSYNRPVIRGVKGTADVLFKNGDREMPRSKYDDLQAFLMSLFPSLLVVCHLVFLEETIRYLVKKGIRKSNRIFNISLLFCWTFILANFAFSVLAAPIVLRYQVLLIVLLTGYTLLLTEVTDAPPDIPGEKDDEHMMLGI